MPVPYYQWDAQKNEQLKAERGISFEQVVMHVETAEGRFLKTVIPSRKATRQYLGDRHAKD